MDGALKQQYDMWLAFDKNETTRSEIMKMKEQNKLEALSKILLNRMEFGTAGLRAAMGAGFARMNDVTVIQATQGLCKYIMQCSTKEELVNKGVIIGYDARHNSCRFARLTANVFLHAGVKTRLFRQIVCTPFVPFGVRHFGCLSGIMVTASHNPKEDNGYKVYWRNGAQIIPPIDTSISQAISQSQEPLESSWQLAEGAIDPFDEIRAAYFNSLASEIHYEQVLRDTSVKFTYTAMHGVGTQFTLDSLQKCGLPRTQIVLVKEQVEPDPEFPTVTFPNPEEGKSALNLAVRTADNAGSTVILANDPDADRLAVAEKLPTGAWHIFTGNEIGALMGWWAVHCFKTFNPDLFPASKCYLISSAVSSSILRHIAAKEGMQFEDTLTGFKWMGSRAQELQLKGFRPLLAFEEAIGFMCGTRVFDKDGVTAAGVMAQMAAFLYKQNRTLKQQLEQHIYAEYGIHCSYNSYVISCDPKKTKLMFEGIINGGHYASQIGGANVRHVRDLSTGLDTSQADKKAKLPLSASSPMLTFTLDNGVTLTIRSSGTEPKIKWYSEIVTTSSNGKQILEATVNAAVEQLIRPDFFGFQRVKEAISKV